MITAVLDPPTTVPSRAVPAQKRRPRQQVLPTRKPALLYDAHRQGPGAAAVARARESQEGNR
jgi:hypothetical protein